MQRTNGGEGNLGSKGKKQHGGVLWLKVTRGEYEGERRFNEQLKVKRCCVEVSRSEQMRLKTEVCL